MCKQSEYYDREKLYEEVWAEPVSKVAQRYGVSNVAIAKTCRKMRIPVPGVGYWNKVSSGQEMKKLALPAFETCPKVQRYFIRSEEIEEKKVERLVPEAFALEDQLIQRESSPGMEIICDPAISLTDQYVRNTEKKLNESRKKISRYYDYGRCSSDNDGSFEVSIGPDNIQRVLVILQTLCTALAKRGYPIGENPKKAHEDSQYQPGYPRRETHPICAIVVDTYISFRITETSNKREIEKKNGKNPPSYEKYEYVPSGRLCFEILDDPYGNHARSKWQDGKAIRVEDQLNDIVINMIKVVAITKENKAQAELQRERLRIGEEKRREQDKLKRIDEARIQNLVKETERMISLNHIRAYVEVISAEGKQRLGDAYPGSDFSRWVEWAEDFLVSCDLGSWKLPIFDLPDPHPHY